MITIESNSLKKAITEINKNWGYLTPDVLDTAIARALNRTAYMGKTEANKNIRNNYNIGVSQVNKAFNLRNANKRNLEASIIASGAPLSWNNFQAKQIKGNTSTSFNRKGVASSRLNRKAAKNANKGVTAIIKKGESVNLPTAFIQVANGGITVFARGKYNSSGKGLEFSKERLPIAKISTTSIPLMFIGNDVMKPTINKTDDVLQKQIEHEIMFILSK